jgi:hypothetical protein
MPSASDRGQGLVLGDGFRREVADPATVEVAGGRVVHEVGVPPAREGREREQPECRTKPTRSRYQILRDLRERGSSLF